MLLCVFISSSAHLSGTGFQAPIPVRIQPIPLLMTMRNFKLLHVFFITPKALIPKAGIVANIGIHRKGWPPVRLAISSGAR